MSARCRQVVVERRRGFMRARITRQRIARIVVVAASLAAVVACGTKRGTNQTEPTGSAAPSPTGTAGPAPSYPAGTLLVSNGTATVMINGKPVIFPTTVTDAQVSTDGSRVAYVDGDGNISTSRLDGGRRIVLTNTRAGAQRAHPTWYGAQIVFEEKGSSGKSTLMMVSASGHHTIVEPAGPIPFDIPDLSGSAPTVDSAPDGWNARDTYRDRQRLAFQHQGPAGAEVWIVDTNQRSPYSAKVADGSQPALSPDGSHVAFVDAGGQIEIVDVNVYPRPKPVRITSGVASARPVWTPDGTQIAFQTSSGVVEVAATGTPGGNAPRQISAAGGVPDFIAAVPDQVITVTSADPVDLAITASQVRWPSEAKYTPTQSMLPARGVLLTGTADPSITLAGAQLAGSVEYGPILLTSGATLDSRTEGEIKRVLGTVPTGIDAPEVVIVGGPAIVPVAAENRVKALGYRTRRVSGTDASGIATAAAKELAHYTAPTSFVVVDSSDPALVAAAWTIAPPWGSLFLLSNGSTLPDAERAILTSVPNDITVYAVGSAAAASVGPATSHMKIVNIDGADTAAVTANLLHHFGADARRLVVVDRSSPVDILVGVGLAREYGVPLLALDPKSDVDSAVRSWLEDSAGTLDVVMVVGSAAGSGLPNAVGGWVGQPGGFAMANNPKAKAQS
jgi:hypothetical protein